MEENIVFPEIHHFINFLSSQEIELYNKEKMINQGNSLTTQHKILKKILKKIDSPSNTLLFIIGKVLFNLVEYDTIYELWNGYQSEYILFWLGLVEFRKGSFTEAEKHFTKIVFAEDPLLKIEGKIGLARISGRKGNKKDASVLFKQVFGELNEVKEDKRKNLFLDAKFRGLFSELWVQRTERNVEEMINQAKGLLKEAEDYADRIHIANIHMLLGIYYKYLGKWNVAKEHFEISRTNFRDLNNLRGEVAVLTNYSEVERMEGKLDSALGRLLSIISFYKQWDDKRSLAIVYSALGQIYAQKRQFKTAIQ
ncbi:MAG: hypothetical protein KAQ70_03965, partial [Candidatus Heimdallarchaeota archaeon]|nr:hypothetical protein [Candidatus Heimdallarchaeota archaeon]